MELIVIIIAAVGIGLLLMELLLPTGGALAVIGAAGLIVAGVIAFGDDSKYADYAGGGLVALGALSILTFFVITPKIVRAQRDEPIRTGWEELIGEPAEVRTPLDPVGNVFVGGALWKARVAGGAKPVEVGNMVLIHDVDGLTLIVGPADATQSSQRGS
jgi:membrane-bound serine protease (ClpP class)